MVYPTGVEYSNPRQEGGGAVIDETTKQKAMARLNRIEGQVQGVRRMVEEEKYCVDILLQISAIQGALEQVSKILLGRHIESCVADAVASGRAGDRQKKIEELLEVFSRYTR
ncbi:MAG: metal-sensitive transcriptional regulator [Candidatus Methylomirabilis oxyfera]|nr:metal-sensitive transcriptional regulator [Candidatus Methylomirabilis oxyfera]